MVIFVFLAMGEGSLIKYSRVPTCLFLLNFNIEAYIVINLIGGSLRSQLKSNHRCVLVCPRYKKRLRDEGIDFGASKVAYILLYINRKRGQRTRFFRTSQPSPNSWVEPKTPPTWRLISL